MYVNYDFDFTDTIYADYEVLRKMYQHDHLSKKKIEEELQSIGFPMKSSKMWKLLKDYEIIIQKGKSRYTYYLFPLDTVPIARFESIEKDYNNGVLTVKKKQETSKEKELARTPINDEYCINYLKSKKKYIILEITDIDVNKLKSIINPALLLELSNIKIK